MRAIWPLAVLGLLGIALPPAQATTPVFEFGKIEAQGSGVTGSDLQITFNLPGTNVDYLFVLDGLVGPTDVVWRAGTASYDETVTVHIPNNGFWRVRLVPMGDTTDLEQLWKTSLFGYSDQHGGVWSQSATALEGLLPRARFATESRVVEQADGNATVEYAIWPLTPWMHHGYLHAKQVVPSASATWVTLAEKWVYSGGQPLQWSVQVQREGPGHAMVGQIQVGLLLGFTDGFDDSGHLTVLLDCVDADAPGLGGRAEVHSLCEPRRGVQWRYHAPSTWPAVPLSDAGDGLPPASVAQTVPWRNVAFAVPALALVALVAFLRSRRQR